MLESMVADALEGKVMLRFVIGSNGTVTGMSTKGSTLPDPIVVECIAQTFLQTQFPVPEAGAVKVVFPVLLSPPREREIR